VYYGFNNVEIVLMETWSGLLDNISFDEKDQVIFRGKVIDTPIILNIPISSSFTHYE